MTCIAMRPEAASGHPDGVSGVPGLRQHCSPRERGRQTLPPACQA